MSIAIVFFPCCDVINFEINFIFLINSFLHMTKKSRQNFRYLEKEKSFSKVKSFFIIFKGLPVAKNCLRPKSAPLRLPSFFFKLSQGVPELNSNGWSKLLYFRLFSKYLNETMNGVLAGQKTLRENLKKYFRQ